MESESTDTPMESSSNPARVRVGTRGSGLALTQSRWVATQLQTLRPGLTVDLEIIKTQGDKITDVPLSQIGGKGLFTKEIENALLDGRVDLAVHSMKDLPTELPPGLILAAVPEREDPHDVLILHTPTPADTPTTDPLALLPKGATVGTSSLRRKAQLLHHRPDLNILDLRGNLDTRLRKVDAGDYDAIVLAAAGLKRMGWHDRVTCPLPFHICLPAVGQGILALECREEDAETLQLLSTSNHADTRWAAVAERTLLLHLEGGCQVPIAATTEVSAGRVRLEALVASLDGNVIVRDIVESDLHSDPAAVGEDLARRLLANGAAEILQAIRANESPHL